MKNKIIKIIAILLASIMVIMPLISAASNTESDLGLSEEVSNGKIVMTQIRSWFTFNQEDKISNEINLARLRLIQAKIATKNGDSKGLENAIMKHERNMNRAQEKFNAFERGNDAKGINDSAATLIRLEKTIQLHEKRINYIGEVIENSTLTESQKIQIRSEVQNMKSSMGELKNIQENKQENLMVQIRTIQGVSAKDANKIVYQESNKTDEESNKPDDTGNKK